MMSPADQCVEDIKVLFYHKQIIDYPPIYSIPTGLGKPGGSFEIGLESPDQKGFCGSPDMMKEFIRNLPDGATKDMIYKAMSNYRK